MTTADRGSAGGHRTVSRFFAEPVRDYVTAVPWPTGQRAPGRLPGTTRELGIEELAEGGFKVTVTAVDADEPNPRACCGTRTAPTTT